MGSFALGTLHWGGIWDHWYYLCQHKEQFHLPGPCCCCCWITLVVSDSVRPHRQQPTRLPRPWDSPGKNTGVGCHFLLQCIKVKSESEVAQSCLTLSDPAKLHLSLPWLWWGLEKVTLTNQSRTCINSFTKLVTILRVRHLITPFL